MAILKSLGYEQNTTLNTAKALTVPGGAQRALIQATGQNVRWRDDGTDPTATVGMQLAAGDSLFYTADLSALKVIEEAASAKLNVTYYA